MSTSNRASVERAARGNRCGLARWITDSIMRLPMRPAAPQEASMSTDQVTLVKSSFAAIHPVADAFATRFYARLFELDPGLRALFKSDMAEQRQKLLEMLEAVVDALDRPALVVEEVAALGRRHASYRVIAE